MLKKNFFRITFTGIVLAASLLLLSSEKPTTAPAPEKEKESTCCKKKMVCPGKNETKAPGEMLLDNLSQQFISMPASFH